MNGSKRHSDAKDKPHANRKWKANDRVMPDFQSFVDFFAPSVIQADPNYVPADENEPQQKLILADDMLPENLLDIDCAKIGVIT